MYHPNNYWSQIPPPLSKEVEDWMVDQAYERKRFAASVALSVKAARKNAGFTQKELATIIGSTQPSLSRLERGYLTDIGTQMLQRIGSALDMETNVVFEKRRSTF